MAAVEAVIEVAHAHNIPELPSVQYQVQWWEPTSEGRAEGRREVREEPSFPALWNMLRDHLPKAPAVTELMADAAAFAVARGKFFIALPTPPERMGEFLLTDYFRRATALKADRDVITATCRTFVSELTSDTAEVLATYAVSGFSAHASFRLVKGIYFRPVNEEDIDLFGRPYRHLIGLHSVPSDASMLNKDDWICEMRAHFRKDDLTEYNGWHEVLEDLLSSLNLAASGTARFQILSQRAVSSFIPFGIITGGRHLSTSKIGNKVVLTGADISTVRRLFKSVRTVRSDKDFEYLRLPLRRLRQAASRTESEDQVLDHVIALERLLCRDRDSTAETTFRFRLRGAAVLPIRFGSPRERHRLMGAIYDLRSKAVHGGSANAKRVAEMRTTTEDVLRAILIWALIKGPTLGDAQEIIQRIDEAMIDGASRLR